MKVFECIRNALFLVAVVVLLGASACIIFQYKPAVVLSGSMEPTFHTGCVVFVDTKVSNSVKVGDAIAFYLADEYVTHRIVDETEDSFITKGDNNSSIDPWRVAKPGSSNDDPSRPQVDGKCVFSIPWIGYVFAFAKSKPGIILIVAIIICLVLSMFLIPVETPVRKTAARSEKQRLEDSYDMLKKEYDSLEKKYVRLSAVCRDISRETGMYELFDSFELAEANDYDRLYDRYMQVLELLEKRNILSEGFKDREAETYKREVTAEISKDDRCGKEGGEDPAADTEAKEPSIGCIAADPV